MALPLLAEWFSLDPCGAQCGCVMATPHAYLEYTGAHFTFVLHYHGSVSMQDEYKAALGHQYKDIERPVWAVGFRRSSGIVTMARGSSAAALLITGVASMWSWADVGEEGWMEGTSGATGLRQAGKSWCRALSSRSNTLMNWRPHRSWGTNVWPLTRFFSGPCGISSVSWTTCSMQNCSFPELCAGWRK